MAIQRDTGRWRQSSESLQQAQHQQNPIEQPSCPLWSWNRFPKREYVQVLRLLESFRLAEVEAAIGDALKLGAIGFDAVKHLVLCRIERRPPRLDLDVYPYLPKARVATTSARSYMSLLGIVTLTAWLRHGRCFSVSGCARYPTVVTAFHRSSSSMPSGSIAVSR